VRSSSSASAITCQRADCSRQGGAESFNSKNKEITAQDEMRTNSESDRYLRHGGGDDLKLLGLRAHIF